MLWGKYLNCKQGFWPQNKHLKNVQWLTRDYFPRAECVTLQLGPLGLWSNPSPGCTGRVREVEAEWYHFQTSCVGRELSCNFSTSLNHWEQLVLPWSCSTAACTLSPSQWVVNLRSDLYFHRKLLPRVYFKNIILMSLTIVSSILILQHLFSFLLSLSFPSYSWSSSGNAEFPNITFL